MPCTSATPLRTWRAPDRRGVMSAAAMWATIDPQAIAEQGPDHLLHRPHQVMAVVANANGYEGSNPVVTSFALALASGRR